MPSILEQKVTGKQAFGVVPRARPPPRRARARTRRAACG